MELTFKDFNLSEEILNALSKLAYTKPTEVQEKVIPLILNKQDLLVKSRTGSGKTAAFGIPICEEIIWEENKPQALILTPTRELAVQVKEDLTNIGRYKRIKATAVYGRQPIAIQKTELSQKTHIVVGTPGRVMDHIRRGNLKLDEIRFLVIDEADEMLNMGFIDQVEEIILELTDNRQTLLFSATMPEDIKNLAERYMNQSEVVEIESFDETDGQIEHFLYRVEDHEKYRLLRAVTVIENPDSCMIFCRTKDQVDELHKRLDRDGYKIEKIHGDLKQEERIKTMTEFKQGRFRYLVATDVAARGIDVEKISLVIHYDIPFDKESYVHRTGRTGRAGQSGRAITFVNDREEHYLKNIEEYLGFPISEVDWPANELVSRNLESFELKMKETPKLKREKTKQLNQQIMKIYFNGGKKKKLRAVDFVGTITSIDGISADDIGIITIMDSASYVEILNGKGAIVLKEMKDRTIKGKKLKVHEARK